MWTKKVGGPQKRETLDEMGMKWAGDQCSVKLQFTHHGVFFLGLDICPACILRESLGIAPQQTSDWFLRCFVSPLLKPSYCGFDLLKDASKVVLKRWSNTNIYLMFKFKIRLWLYAWRLLFEKWFGEFWKKPLGDGIVATLDHIALVPFGHFFIWVYQTIKLSRSQKVWHHSVFGA